MLVELKSWIGEAARQRQVRWNSAGRCRRGRRKKILGSESTGKKVKVLSDGRERKCKEGKD